MYDQKVARPWLGGLLGGQGATCLDEGDVRCYDSSGDGGKAGNGGNITVSQVCEINAFNGNECTLNKSDSAYYYKPVEIYIQKGHLLEIRKFNTWWGIKKNVNYQFFYDILGDTLEDNVKDVTIGDSIEKIKNILIRSEKEDDNLKLSYIDNGKILYVGQGIGSGAGYIEVSNGTYTVDASMN